MMAYTLRDGRLVVPFRAETGDTIGDALIAIEPSHPDYERWQQFTVPAPVEIEKTYGDRQNA